MGEGPMTGRQLGYGAGYDSPGYTKGQGWGGRRGFFGHGRGFFGRGFFSRRFYTPENLEDQPDSVNQIKSDVQMLQSGLNSILERLNKLLPKDEKK
jgi:hypothetical protein